jgi:D-beta-D-heptose 7-phosphate kinase / D-beta-D-heptose 1-phosphate adenosyltransferase
MKAKVIKYHALKSFRDTIKSTQKVVLVTGVFDLLHRGHIQFLEKAKEQGDILLVGLEGDERVKQLKGQERPIQAIDVRLRSIIKLAYVDFAFALPDNFDSIERERFIATLRPDVLAVSSHSLHRYTKQVLIGKYGGMLKVVMEQDKSYSTTNILTMKQSKKKSAK